MKPINYILTPLLLTALLTVGCSDDEQTTDNTTAALQLNLSEEPWEGETLQLTRATATEEGLKTSTTGFGLYCSEFKMAVNTQVTWDATHQRWDYGNLLLWPHKMSTTVNMYAYAPYDVDGTYADGSSSGVLTFNTTIDNTTDLLCAGVEGAQRTTENKGTIALNFQHVLAKLSFGTITNHYGRPITLDNISVTGTLYTRRKLEMATGVWRDEDATPASLTKKYTPLNQNVAAGETTDFTTSDTPLLLIPGPTVNVTFTISTTDFGTESFTFSNIPLEKGVNKTLNLTINNNFEVVITD